MNTPINENKDIALRLRIVVSKHADFSESCGNLSVIPEGFQMK